ncbi:putative 3-demethylubiquinone-9 3-methyltransferase (glyoxalase superfamily) [Planomicrobium koreense]|uniref:Putative 3-demethylubiquinone-9 3-methyltransferase (Glyoxalase superfamily) n=1 Tax=Planococcus koreensis TaxID=112331 RepID=A0A7W8FTA2_9BACL|nr:MULTISPECIES: VOC family protein [Planococcus]MBB5179846.1 putative 3-demethylubiquinone-9 3-methyltransferase (glyoxalase superfamily) [Planococcus koreensis]MDN3451781.1 VOC family protein [Planococcus sp. APC 3906]
MEQRIQKIVANLWFEKVAEEAARYYVSIFKNASIGRILYYSQEGFEIHHMAEGTVLTVEFTLEGQKFLALNGDSAFKFTEAVSFIINCESQEEIDYYWNRLTVGGDEEAQNCGWLKDKFGVSWQVSPVQLDDMLADSDPERVKRVTKVMLEMKKLDLAELQKAFEG